VKKTGEVLKKAREDKGLSLHEVGIFLKINTRILQAIENGDLSKLPAKTFLRGFVQSYAKYLKLNSDEILKLFQSELKPPIEETPEAEVISQPEEVLAPQTEEPEAPVTNRSATNQSVLMGPGLTTDTLKLKTIVISALALVLVFVVYFGNNLIKRYQKEAEVPNEIALINPSNNSEDTTTSSVLIAQDPEKPEDKILTDPVSSAATPAASATAPTPTTVTASTPVAKPVASTPQVTALPAATPSTVTPIPVPQLATQQKTASETTSLPTTPVSTPSGETKPTTEGKSVEVIVEAKDNVEIEYASAKSNPQKLLLKGDQIHTFKSRSGIRLKISNGGAVNIIVNGQDLGAPGAIGQSIQLNYE